jgi:magnesium chelatase subunit D
MDDGKAALVLLDDAAEPDEAPPVSLTERLALACDLTHSR